MKIRKKVVLRIRLIVSFLLFVSPLAYTYADDPVAPVENGKKEEVRFPVDFDFRDADIRDVARAFSHISQKNIIVSDDVKANVTLRVQAMDWKEALNMILGAYNITLLEKDDYIIITTAERRKQAEEAGALETRVVRLNFVNVADTQKTLVSMLTSRGRIEIDTRTNSLVVTDIPDRVNQIQQVAVQLDTKTPQVMIEALILTVKLTDDEQLGIDWTLKPVENSEWKFNQALSLGRSTGFQIDWSKTVLPTWADLATLIEYWKEQKRVNIIANPRVLTLDNLTATIDLTEQVPYLSQTQSTSGSSEVVQSTQFKDIPISLYVKPHITKDNFIFMNIKTEQSIHSGDTSDNQPIVDSRKAETNVMVKSGETVVIGGLRKKEYTTTEDKLPFLGDLPGLGHLFKKTIKTQVDTELVIFITPRIATDVVLSDEDAKRLGKAQRMNAGEKPEQKEMRQLRKTEAAPIDSSQQVHQENNAAVLRKATPFPLRAPTEIK